MKDHYATLQVTRDAELEVIEKAYRALSLKHHPDVAAASVRAGAERRMRALNDAYAVLSDPDRRRIYDASLPTESTRAWERFLEVGLVGMFADHLRDRSS